MEPFGLTTSAASAASASRTVAPEDLAPGRYIAVLRERGEFVRGGSCDVPVALYVESLSLLPDKEDIAPMKIVATCLPFVLVQKPDGSCATLDVRAVTLAELDPRYGRLAFRRLKAKPSEESGGSSRKKTKKKRRRRK